MNTKHKPATALPWSVNAAQVGYTAVEAVNVRSVARANGGKKDRENFVYIAHSANAYPKLVGALRDVLAMMHPEAVDGLIAAHAHALLRDLGELEGG
jgi:hypothetical protein